MGPFNLPWKTWVILAGGFAPNRHSDSNFVHVCLSTNPPIEIYPRLCHSSRVLAVWGEGWEGRVYSRLPKQPRGFSGKETEVTQAYIPTWTPNILDVASVPTFLWKCSILQVFSAKHTARSQSTHLRWRDNLIWKGKRVNGACARHDGRFGWKMYEHVKHGVVQFPNNTSCCTASKTNRARHVSISWTLLTHDWTDPESCDASKNLLHIAMISL